MTERDDRIGELYEAALRKAIGERSSFVASRAGTDVDLRRRVEALLEGQQDTVLPGYEAGSGAMLEAGTAIGQYRIDGPLGAGGMGVVYRATDTRLNRPAAIKVLPENLADPEARRRFQREAQMVSSLNHPHIVTVYDAGEYQHRQYLITEYVDGGTLRQWAARPRGWRSIVELLIGVADGIATAHDAGILHRDIKPENILLAKNGYAKLADFGLAKLLEADPLADDALGAIKPGGHSSLIGTAAYMSPEQMQGVALDGRSDVYSFGLVLYELLKGTRPFRSLEMGTAAADEALPPLGDEVPAELRTLVAKALEAEPADRYQTMRDLVVDLRRVARRSGIDTSSATAALEPALTVAPPRRFADRRLWTFAAALALLALVGFATREAFFGTRSARSVAVLPFVNESGGIEDLPISEGLGDQLRERLMALPGLSVQARASSISFRDQDVDMRTIADTLDVGRVINGSVRRHGRTLEVVVEILNDRGFAVAPPLRFQGLDTALQAMQLEIATQVSKLLAPDANDVVAETPTTMPTSESESANLLVVFGSRYEHQVKDNLSVDEATLDKAIDMYRRATLADPSSVAAHSRLAGALLYKGEIDAALAPLERALELGKSIDPSSKSADLSDAYYTWALYLLRTNAGGEDEAYRSALALNPSNVDALGAYAQWLMSHNRSRDADAYFREAIRLDRRSLSRYVDYAEYLAIREDMDRVRDVAREIESGFPNARGYLALARAYELTGNLDVGIAWGLKAYRQQPNDDETHGQVAELYARIGDFDMAADLDPRPYPYQPYFRRSYDELIELAQEKVISEPQDLNARYMLAFAYNATEKFALAKYLLETMGFPPPPGSESNMGGPAGEALLSYYDALQGLGGNDALVKELAGYKTVDLKLAAEGGASKSWWVNTLLACGQAQLDQYEEALDSLDRVRVAQGLPTSPLLLDSPCFKRLAAEPRYQSLIDHLEERRKILRERLPATLREFGVADVAP